MNILHNEKGGVMEGLLKITFNIHLESKKNDVLKLLGIVFMIIDHIGEIFFPDVIIFRIFGRLSYPIFAYGIAIGYQYTKNFKSYLLRLSLFFIVSQPFFTLVFQKGINIFATLLIGLIAIYFYDKKQYPSIVLLFIIAQFLALDYGLYGLGLILTFYIFKDNLTGLVLSQIAINIVFAMHYHTLLQAYSLIALIFIYKNEWFINIHLNKYIGYMFYPIHLGLIALTTYWLF
jgi:hypothetical protein